MSSTTLALMIFAGIASLTAASGMLIRDLFSRSPRRRELELVRLPLARHDVPRQALTSELDRRFERVVVETGWECSPLTVALLLVTIGVSVGGAVLVAGDNPPLAAAGAMAGIGLGLVTLLVCSTRRMQRIQSQLPDALEMLARAVRAGESIDQAIEMAGERGSEPLAREFRRCSRHLAMGLSLAAAMRSLVFRAQLMEVRILSTTLSVHRQSGGNLAATLERLSSVVRQRLNYRRQLRATTAAGRFSAMLVASTGPLLFAYLFLVQPEYMQGMLREPLGQTLLMTAVVLELVGLAWVVHMLRIDL